MQATLRVVDEPLAKRQCVAQSSKTEASRPIMRRRQSGDSLRRFILTMNALGMLDPEDRLGPSMKCAINYNLSCDF